MNFRPVPVPDFDRKPMLRQGKLDPNKLIESLTGPDQSVIDDITNKVAKVLEKTIPGVLSQPGERGGRGQPSSGGGAAGTQDISGVVLVISKVTDAVSSSLTERGLDVGNLAIDKILERSVRKAVKDLLEQGKITPEQASQIESVADKIARGIRERIDRIASSVIRSADLSEMSDEDYKRLMDMIAELDMKQHGVGVGEGSGILSQLWVKLVTDPRTREYIRRRLQELRTAAHYRQLNWPRGVRLNPRETFRKYARTQIPFPPVYTTKLIRPKTREDIIFFADVSGSMSVAYPAIYALMRAMEDLGLNVRMYVGDTEVAYVDDVDKVLSRRGGGGTLIGKGVNTILSELGGTVKDTTFIVYTDLEFNDEDFGKFVSGLEKLRSAGSKVSVWVYDCDYARESVSVLEKEGFNVVCDVRSLGDMIDAAKQLKRFILKRA